MTIEQGKELEESDITLFELMIHRTNPPGHMTRRSKISHVISPPRPRPHFLSLLRDSAATWIQYYSQHSSLQTTRPDDVDVGQLHLCIPAKNTAKARATRAHFLFGASSRCGPTAHLGFPPSTLEKLREGEKLRSSATRQTTRVHFSIFAAGLSPLTHPELHSTV